MTRGLSLVERIERCKVVFSIRNKEILKRNDEGSKKLFLCPC
jgi:hypothetical protein